jgi:hypothetical protein
MGDEKKRGQKMKNLGPSRNQSEGTSIDRGLFLSIEDQSRKQTDSTSIDRGMFLSIEQLFQYPLSIEEYSYR